VARIVKKTRKIPTFKAKVAIPIIEEPNSGKYFGASTRIVSESKITRGIRLPRSIALRKRLKEINITEKNVANLTDIKKSDVLKIVNGLEVTQDIIKATTNFLGVDDFGVEIISAKKIVKNRARQKAYRVVSMVQDTSSLEAQGLESIKIKRMIVKTEKEFITGPYNARLWNK
jgi:hypothetical protein